MTGDIGLFADMRLSGEEEVTVENELREEFNVVRYVTLPLEIFMYSMSKTRESQFPFKKYYYLLTRQATSLH